MSQDESHGTAEGGPVEEEEVSSLLRGIISSVDDLSSVSSRDIRDKLLDAVKGRPIVPRKQWLRAEIKRITQDVIGGDTSSAPAESLPSNPTTASGEAERSTTSTSVAHPPSPSKSPIDGSAADLVGEEEVTRVLISIVGQSADRETMTVRTIRSELRKRLSGRKMAPGKDWIKAEIKRVFMDHMASPQSPSGAQQEEKGGEEEKGGDEEEGGGGEEEGEEKEEDMEEEKGGDDGNADEKERSQEMEEEEEEEEEEEQTKSGSKKGKDDGLDKDIFGDSDSEEEGDWDRDGLLSEMFGGDEVEAQWNDEAIDTAKDEAAAAEGLKRVVKKQQDRKRKKRQEMMEEEEHKREDAKRSRPKRRASEIDPEVWRDRTAKFVLQMREAAEKDIQANESGSPGIFKMKLLADLERHMQSVQLHQLLIEHDFLSTLKMWLDPLPDKSLPSLNVRSTILRHLQTFRLQKEDLFQSKLGHAVMFLRKHPLETRQNKLLARDLIQEWSRPIFGQSTDYRDITRKYSDGSIQPQRRMSVKGTSVGSRESAKPKGQRSDDFTKLLESNSGYREQTDTSRARIPQPTYKDYKRMPVPSIDYDSKGSMNRARALHVRLQRFSSKRQKRVGTGR